MKCRWLIFIVLFLSPDLIAQEDYLSGVVTDSISHEPLAFVSIVYNQAGQGVVTNLDGIFRIPLSNKVQFLKLRYVGYRTKTIRLVAPGPKQNLQIQLSPDPTDIAEVIVYPTENPAHRIIKLASANRQNNNPEKSGPFSYIAYEKMIFGMQSDSSLVDNADTLSMNSMIDDTIRYGMDGKGRIDVRRFLEKQYLFMMETVSSRKFFSPEKNREEIIASKVSGISQPSFMVIARQFQSFSFYENFINIADRQFLNPISSGSTDKYFFEIRDTLYSERADTVFIIAFRPLKGRNFEGMKGVLYINSNGYAVQNVLAEAWEQKGSPVTVSIQQQYDLINGTRWFPVLLSTTIKVNPARFGYKDAPIDLVGTGKSYIVNINFNPEYIPSEFSDVQLEVNPDAHRQSEQVWSLYRTDSLNSRELETYRVIDSLGKAEHLDRTIVSFETLLTGYLPGRYWNFDIRRFIDYNPYEGFRFGAGGRTTHDLSKLFTAGGYLAYSTKDKAIKYGGELTFNLWKPAEVDISLQYRDDVRESGGLKFNETWTISGSAFIRDYMVELMDRVIESEVSLNFRALKYLTGRPYFSYSHIYPAGNYDFEPNPELPLPSYFISETGIMLKYAYKETFIRSPRGNKFSMGTNYPVFYLNIAGSGSWFDGDYEYVRTEAKITKTFKTKSLGETRIAIIGGHISSGAPYYKLYAGIASYRPFTLETEQSFGTMRFNEFLSDRFVGIFLKQDFGKLLFKPKGKFQPELALIQNIGFGSLKSSPYEHLVYRTMDKGYFESGILINNIFRISALKYGVGALYRYGPYSYQKTIDNFAFKLTVQLNL